jgi:hypothetical protein
LVNERPKIRLGIIFWDFIQVEALQLIILSPIVLVRITGDDCNSLNLNINMLSLAEAFM